MPLKTHTKKFGKETYTTTTVTTTDGLEIMPRLAALLGQDGLALLLTMKKPEAKAALAKAGKKAAKKKTAKKKTAKKKTAKKKK